MSRNLQDEDMREAEDRLRRQCVDMERQLAALKGSLEAKNREIERLKRRNWAEGCRLSRVDSPTVRTYQQMKTYEAFLSQENAHLRKSVQSQVALPRVQRDLEEARRMQQFYKAKLAELRDKTLSDVEQKKSSCADEQSLLAEQREMLAQVQSVREELKELEEERDYFRDTVVPVLQRTVSLFAQYKSGLLNEIEELQKKTEPHKKEDTLPSSFVASSLPPLSPRLPKSPRSSSTSLHTKSSSLTRPTHGYDYTPSYLRLRKKPLFVKTHRETASAGTIQEVEDDFANSFPEEDELRMD